jgi:hypothetical protein
MKKTVIAGIVTLWAIVVGSYATQMHHDRKFGKTPKPIVMSDGTSCTTTTTTTTE